MWLSCHVPIPVVAIQGCPHSLRPRPLQRPGPQQQWRLLPCWYPQPAHPRQAGNCTQLGRAGLAGTAAILEHVGTGSVGEGSGGPRGCAGWWRGRGSAWAPGGGPGSVLTGPCPTELSASDESSMSDAGLLEEGEGAVGSRGDTRVPLVCSLRSNPSCVPSIPTLPVSSPSQPTQVPSIPLHCHVFPPCHSCVSLPTPHMSPLCHSPVCHFHPNPPHVPSMPTIHLFPPSQPSLCVPSIPTLHLSYRGHTATRTCHPTEVPISKGPCRGGVGASDGPPHSLAGDQPGQTL